MIFVASLNDCVLKRGKSTCNLPFHPPTLKERHLLLPKSVESLALTSVGFRESQVAKWTLFIETGLSRWIINLFFADKGWGKSLMVARVGERLMKRSGGSRESFTSLKPVLIWAAWLAQSVNMLLLISGL